MKPTLSFLLVLSLLVVACSTDKHDKKPPKTESPAAGSSSSAAVDENADFAVALRQGRFEAASVAAAKALEKDSKNPVALVVRAVVTYRATMLQLLDDLRGVAESADHVGAFDHDRARAAYERTEKALAAVDGDLETAGAAANFALELCLACWEEDWNRNGRLDDGDRQLLQIELDADGNEIPEGDPRRKPTFRFDQGDIYWARAMIAFQRALLDLVLAYRWTELDKLIDGLDDGSLPKITIRLADRDRAKAARARILDGLGHADRARELYLAETDDDREWLPNPKQKSHPMPLPVDAALYTTWKDITGDVRRLVSGEDCIDVHEVAMMLDDDWPAPPKGYIDLGALLAEPRDFVFDTAVLSRTDPDEPGTVEASLRSLLGDRYTAEMKSSKPTPLVGRLARMKGEIESGGDLLDRKLRYLFWLN